MCARASACVAVVRGESAKELLDMCVAGGGHPVPVPLVKLVGDELARDINATEQQEFCDAFAGHAIVKVRS